MSTLVRYCVTLTQEKNQLVQLTLLTLCVPQCYCYLIGEIPPRVRNSPRAITHECGHTDRGNNSKDNRSTNREKALQLYGTMATFSAHNVVAIHIRSSRYIYILYIITVNLGKRKMAETTNRRCRVKVPTQNDPRNIPNFRAPSADIFSSCLMKMFVTHSTVWVRTSSLSYLEKISGLGFNATTAPRWVDNGNSVLSFSS